ncbi:MAG: hypothetical protein JNM66_16805 [Bryobacterales bacterium]|nr:hypothetical protein [Bryobacterales bacterium]
MRRVRTILLLSIGLLRAQQVHLMDGVNSVENGVFVNYRTLLEPATAGGTVPRLSGGVITARQSIHRYVEVGELAFGYDLSVRPVQSGRDIEIRIGPLTLTPEEMARFSQKNLRMAPLAKYPSVTTVRSGSTIEVEILRHSGTGQRVFDLLTLTVEPTRMASNWGLRLVAPVAMAGKLTAKFPATLSGDLVTVQVPEMGVLTVGVHALRGRGYQRVGEVDGSVMRVRWAGTEIEVTSTENVVPGGGKWTLYGRLTSKNGGSELQLGISDL